MILLLIIDHDIRGVKAHKMPRLTDSIYSVPI